MPFRELIKFTILCSRAGNDRRLSVEQISNGISRDMEAIIPLIEHTEKKAFKALDSHRPLPSLRSKITRRLLAEVISLLLAHLRAGKLFVPRGFYLDITGTLY